MSRPRRPCSKTASTCTFFGLLCSTVGRSACGTSTNWGMHLDIGSDSSVAQVSRPAPRCTIPPCSATAAQQVDRCNQVGQRRRRPQWPNVCSGPMCAVRHATHAPVPRSVLRRRLGRLRAWPPAKPPAACPLAPYAPQAALLRAMFNGAIGLTPRRVGAWCVCLCVCAHAHAHAHSHAHAHAHTHAHAHAHAHAHTHATTYSPTYLPSRR